MKANLIFKKEVYKFGFFHEMENFVYLTEILRIKKNSLTPSDYKHILNVKNRLPFLKEVKSYGIAV
jgi:hypothetical protein